MCYSRDMALQQTIKEEMINAMKARDTVTTSVLRGLITAFTNELVATKRKPDGILADDEALAVIRRQAKQRKDSIEQFTAGGRSDLAQKEAAELHILETYLPAMIDKEAVATIAQAKKAELAITDPAQKGQLMSALMKELKGKAEGSTVKEVVDELLW